MQPQTTTDLASVRSNLLTRMGLAAVGLKILELGARTPAEATQAREYQDKLVDVIITVNQATDVSTLATCEASLLDITTKSRSLT